MGLLRGRGAGWMALGMWGALTGCATYSGSFAPVERCLAGQRPAEALEVLDGQRHPARDRMLYLLNRAMLLRQTGDYRASNEEFEQAKALRERLTALSITEQAASFLLNDGSRSYEGEPHEQVLIHLYEALNYLEAGDPEEARVEALQVDLLLRRLADRAPESPFSTDPFARYLAGLVYEEQGEWSDAMISYRKAYEAYRAHAERYPLRLPASLQQDLVRMAERVGLHEEAERYRGEFGLDGPGASPLEGGRGEIVFLFHRGLAPVKREQILPYLDPSSGVVVTLALPRYEVRREVARRALVAAEGQRGETEVVEDIEAIALANHEALLPGITARAAARAVVKYAVARKARDENAAVGALLNLAAVLTERADTRSWLSLPSEIQMARLPLPPGRHRVSVDVLGAGNAVLCRREFAGVVVEEGRRTYLSYHWVAP